MKTMLTILLLLGTASISQAGQKRSGSDACLYVSMALEYHGVEIGCDYVIAIMDDGTVGDGKTYAYAIKIYETTLSAAGTWSALVASLVRMDQEVPTKTGGIAVNVVGTKQVFGIDMKPARRCVNLFLEMGDDIVFSCLTKKVKVYE